MAILQIITVYLALVAGVRAGDHGTADALRPVNEDCKVFPVGNYRYRSLQSEPPTVGVTEDGKSKFHYTDGGKAIDIVSLDDGKTLGQVPLLPKNGEPRVFISNGSTVVVRGNSLQVSQRDKPIVLPNQLGQPKFIQVSSTHKMAAYVQSYSNTDDARVAVVDLKSGKIEYIHKPASKLLQDGKPHQIVGMALLEEKNTVASLHDTGFFSLWDQSTKREKTTQLFKSSLGSVLSHDAKQAYSLSPQGDLEIWNTDGALERSYGLTSHLPGKLATEPKPILKVSDNGKSIAIVAGQTLLLVDLETGKTQSVAEPHLKKARSIAFSKDGTHLKTDSDDPYALSRNDDSVSHLFSLIPRPKSVSLAPRFKRFVFANGESGEGPRVLGLGGGKDTPYVIENLKTRCLATSATFRKLPLDPHERESVKAGLSAQCDPSLSKENRRKKLDAFSNTGEWSLEKAYQALFLLQAPGVMDAEKDLALILGLIDSGFLQSDPQLMVGVLANLTKASTMLYENLIEQRPELQSLHIAPRLGASNLYCLSEQDQEQVRRTSVDYLNLRLGLFMERDGRTAMPAFDEDWEYLRPLTPLFSTLSRDERLHHIEYTADTLFAAANNDPRLSMIPDSIKISFANEAINPLFGEPKMPRTDAVFNQDRSNPKLFVIANDELTSEHTAPVQEFRGLGFRLKEIPLPQYSDTANVRWRVGSQNYEAAVRIRSNIPTMAEDEVNAHLTHPESCKITQENSHWNRDGVLGELLQTNPARRSRVIVTTGGDDLLSKCQDLKTRLGRHSCENIEITGHMSGGCGAASLFAVMSRRPDGVFPTIPSDPALFQNIINCFREVLRDGKPIVVTACYSSQAEPMRHLSTMLRAPVIAAGGLCSSVGWGAHSTNGWSSFDPNSDPPVVITQVR